MTVCPACGTENLEGMVFCVQCGGPIGQSDGDVDQPNEQTVDDHHAESSDLSQDTDTPDGDGPLDGASDAGDTALEANDEASDSSAESDMTMETDSPSVDVPGDDALDEPALLGTDGIDEPASIGSDVNGADEHSDESSCDMVSDEPTQGNGSETAETDSTSEDMENSGEMADADNQPSPDWVETSEDTSDQEPTFENDIVDDEGESERVASSSNEQDENAEREESSARLNPLADLPSPPQGPISPLQLKDGGESLYGQRWWLRPEAVDVEPADDAADGDGSIVGADGDKPIDESQSMKVSTPRAVIELDRRRFDELPTLEESESKGRGFVIAGVVAAVVIGLIIFMK